MPNSRAPGVTPHTIAFPDELWARVLEVAARGGTSASAVIRAAVEDQLKRLEP